MDLYIISTLSAPTLCLYGRNVLNLALVICYKTSYMRPRCIFNVDQFTAKTAMLANLSLIVLSSAFPSPLKMFTE